MTRVTDLLLVITELKAAAADAAASLRRAAGPAGFDRARVVAPDGKVVATDLTLALPEQQPEGQGGGMPVSVLVTGANGCGKSALFRVLAGLWPVAAGSARPPAGAVFVGQRPLATATRLDLLQFLVFPEHLATAEDGDRAKRLIRPLLAELGIDYVVEREGWTGQKHWADVLSLGEQQCLGCVRMFYHLDRQQLGGGVRWAVMDCCLTGLSGEVKRLLSVPLRCLASRFRRPHGHSHIVARSLFAGRVASPAVCRGAEGRAALLFAARGRGGGRRAGCQCARCIGAHVGAGDREGVAADAEELT